jgi:hypothetical protein
MRADPSEEGQGEGDEGGKEKAGEKEGGDDFLFFGHRILFQSHSEYFDALFKNLAEFAHFHSQTPLPDIDKDHVMEIPLYSVIFDEFRVLKNFMYAFQVDFDSTDHVLLTLILANRVPFCLLFSFSGSTFPLFRFSAFPLFRFSAVPLSVPLPSPLQHIMGLLETVCQNWIVLKFEKLNPIEILNLARNINKEELFLFSKYVASSLFSLLSPPHSRTASCLLSSQW